MNIHEGEGSVIDYSCFTVSDAEISRFIVGGA